MSGNPQLDMQIARAVQPQFNPMQAIQQMQRPAVQMPVQNPFFGGPIPMQFGLPQVNQIPAGYQPRLSEFRPSQESIDSFREPKLSMQNMIQASGGETGDFFGYQGDRE